MRILLTRLSDERHVLELVRADGSRERAELETRSTLRHDLTHLALEQEARLPDGFFGSLAAGRTLAELGGDTIYTGRMLEIERAVVVLQGMSRDADPRAVHARIVQSLGFQGERPPEWFTEEVVAGVQGRLRGLFGRWGATPHGSALELEWSGDDPRGAAGSDACRNG